MAHNIVEQPPPPLPDGWTENVDAGTGNVFYHLAATGETTWSRPTGPAPQVLPSHFPLPENWCEYVDPSTGAIYYHCQATGETTWERPVPAPPAPHADSVIRTGRHELPPGLPGAFIVYLKANPHITDSIRTFQSENQHNFAGDKPDEWSLAATTSYEQFVALIDTYLQPFLSEQGVTPEIFADSVRGLQQTNSVHFHAFSLMLQRLDFPQLANLMRSKTCLCCGGFFMGVNLEGGGKA